VTVDGQSPDDIRRILDNEISASFENGSRSVAVFETMGGYAPAMGLIGTLIGLVQMLEALGDASTVGPAMSVALLTTLYGAILANMFLLPVAGKLNNRIREEILIKQITVDGLMSVARDENPIMLEQRLQSYILQ